MHSSLERLFEFYAIRFGAAAFFLLRGYFYLLAGRRYRAVRDLCWIVRVANVRAIQRIANRKLMQEVAQYRRGPVNPLVESYRADRVSKKMAASYSISGSGRNDLFRDLIVLKRPQEAEKGVILLKYARTFSAAVALLDLSRLMERYVFVLEPCWSGYCDPALLMFIAAEKPVVVQCFTSADYDFIAGLETSLVPVRLGPADWVDADVFAPPNKKTKSYDLVMVANWAKHKRHIQLFRALQSIRDRDIRVLLIGFAWAKRSAEDIRKEAAKYPNDRVTIDILENVPQPELAGHVSECKVFVFLSRKEGDNKAVVEAMFANVPAIVYEKTIGGAVSRINPATGVFAADEELADKIVYMLDHYQELSPRAWALEHTGSAIATKLLNDHLREAVTKTGGVYSRPIVEKTNAPNLAYKDPTCRTAFKEDYAFILSCVRMAGKETELVRRRAAA